MTIQLLEPLKGNFITKYSEWEEMLEEINDDQKTNNKQLFCTAR